MCNKYVECLRTQNCGGGWWRENLVSRRPKLTYLSSICHPFSTRNQFFFHFFHFLTLPNHFFLPLFYFFIFIYIYLSLSLYTYKYLYSSLSFTTALLRLLPYQQNSSIINTRSPSALPLLHFLSGQYYSYISEKSSYAFTLIWCLY